MTKPYRDMRRLKGGLHHPGAGVVERTGPAMTRVRPGDGVYFRDGGFGPVPGT